MRASVILSVGVACLAACQAPDRSVEETQQPVTLNPGSTTQVARENNSRDSGRYPEVVLVTGLGGGCTGTILGPYLVMTAKHCAGVNVSWNEQTHAVGEIVDNPYLVNFQPPWWAVLNNQQKQQPGGRQDDWPAQHDQRILLVPTLTPALLAQAGIKPAKVDSYAAAPSFQGTPSFRIVGVASTGGSLRDSAPVRHLAATPNNIVQSPFPGATPTRDGYVTRDASTANFATSNFGDSGGPTFASILHPWLGGTTFEGDRYMVGTTQNPVDSAPLAFNPGISMTANQKFTVTLNSLWALARIGDNDYDGVPNECDTSPANFNPAGGRCPPAVGGPLLTATTRNEMAQQLSWNSAEARLACEPGYVAVGVSARIGFFVDKLSVKCRAISCIDQSCSAPEDEYWTDGFGGTGGGHLDLTCPDGQVMVGFHGREDVGQTVRTFGLRCAPWLAARLGSSQRTSLDHWGSHQGTFYTSDCAGTETLIGFQARTNQPELRWITGLRAICSGEAAGIMTQMGGLGGRAVLLACPEGTSPTGTLQNFADSRINAFGVVCSPSGTNTASWVARGGYMNFDGGFRVWPNVERYATRKLPSGTNEASCPVGSNLFGIEANVDSGVRRIHSIICRRRSDGLNTWVPVGVGTATPGSNLRESRCFTVSSARGVYLRYGFGTDLIGMHCRKN
jgi:hypothetical protein